MSEYPDRITLRGLELVTRIGVHDWERRVRQTLLVDVELPVAAAAAAEQDALEAALDYSAVAAELRHCAADSDCRLIETLAEHLAATVLATFTLPWVRLTLHKPGAVDACAPVALTIERRARPAG